MKSGRCAACKDMRKKCPSDCIFSPYFPRDDPMRYECVHRIYGASNFARMIKAVFGKGWMTTDYILVPENKKAIINLLAIKNWCVARGTEMDLPVEVRGEAAEAMYVEARYRVEDPIYGCVKFISQLQHEIHVAMDELARIRAEIAILVTWFGRENGLDGSLVND